MKNQFFIIIISLMIINSISIFADSHLLKDNIQDINTNNNQVKNTYNKNINFLKSYNLELIDLFKSNIKTICNGYEKNSEIFFGITNEINVDGNDNTGVNGNDLAIQYMIIPWIDLNSDLSIGLKFLFNVERIGEEIKNYDLNLSASIGEDAISIGYFSPEKTENEIPKKISFSLLAFINTITAEKGLKFNINPSYDTSIENKEIILYGKNYNSEENMLREYQFSFTPSTESEITISSTSNEGEWHYEFSRLNNYDIDFIGKIKENKNDIIEYTSFKFFSIPKNINFNFIMTPFTNEGGSFQYQSNAMYNTKVQIESTNLGICKYAIIENIPRKIVAEWLPIRENGYYYINVDSDGTDISLLNSLENPTINLSLNRVSNLDLKAYWNFTNPGDFRIIKEPSLNIDIKVIIDDWEFLLNAQPIAEDIQISWLTDISGYLTYDTNWQPINQMDLLIKGSDLGIRAVADFFKSQDFKLEWTIWPLIEWNIEKTGEYESLSLLIEVFIQGNWYRLWPW